MIGVKKWTHLVSLVFPWGLGIVLCLTVFNMFTHLLKWLLGWLDLLSPAFFHIWNHHRVNGQRSRWVYFLTFSNFYHPCLTKWTTKLWKSDSETPLTLILVGFFFYSSEIWKLRCQKSIFLKIFHTLVRSWYYHDFKRLNPTMFLFVFNVATTCYRAAETQNSDVPVCLHGCA